MSDDVSYHYWSNGTEGRAWEANWCHRCENDHRASHVPDGDYGEGCEIAARRIYEYDHRTIPELVEPDPRPMPGPVDRGVVCLAFAPCRWCDPDTDDPTPVPVPLPGQTSIYDFETADA